MIFRYKFLLWRSFGRMLGIKRIRSKIGLSFIKSQNDFKWHLYLELSGDDVLMRIAFPFEVSKSDSWLCSH